MSSFSLTPDAKQDLLNIRTFTVKKWGSTQAKSYLSDLRETIGLLAQTPTLGKKREDVAKGVYSFPHSSHVIYYKLHKKHLVVFAVLHKRMVPLNHLVDREHNEGT
jgi:toxin ParE1/3/4